MRSGPTPAQLSEIAKKLRIHSLVSTSKAGSGHPTTCLSVAEIMACLFFGEMHYDVKNPNNPGNDELILSKGHAAPILWACYAEAGIIPVESLNTLRDIHSRLEGHPTARMPWIKVSTGSLGQGLSAGVGMALSQRLLDSPAQTYVVLGDGELAEGMIWEAANMAHDQKLANICAIVDCNRLGQSGPTMHQHNTERYKQKFEAFGWYALVIDGHDTAAIIDALEECRMQDVPCAIIARTFKGKGVSFLENKDGWHGKTLSARELESALKELGPMPDISSSSFIKQAYKVQLKKAPKPPAIPLKRYSDGLPVATRAAYGHALLEAGRVDDRIVAIDGDVQNSTGAEDFFNTFKKRSFQSFIAEQNMAGISLGLAAKGYIPFAATFAAFWTRAHDVFRMAQYSGSNAKFVGSHVGVSIGEDGPSQMGLEDIAMFRSIPSCIVLYPCDGVSTQRCVHEMINHKGLCYLRTTRPKTPLIYEDDETFPIGGSKVLKQSKKDSATIIAAGITVHNSLAAYESLEKEGIFVRIIDAYSVQPLDSKTILKAAKETKNIIVVEDHYPAGGLGEAVSSLGIPITHLCIKDLPRSGKSEELMEMYGISANQIVKKVKELLK